jgi:hypothetical protein
LLEKLTQGKSLRRRKSTLLDTKGLDVDSPDHYTKAFSPKSTAGDGAVLDSTDIPQSFLEALAQLDP